MQLNKRFNRLESQLDHFYFSELGGADFRFHYEGILKCKLMHGEGHSIFVPDQIFLRYNDSWGWILPLAFHPHSIVRFSDFIMVDLHVDISCRQTLRIRFRSNDFIRGHPDCSQSYLCEIAGPENLRDYVTGDARISEDDRPYIRLYHHTSVSSLESILESRRLRTGSCNFQGTTRNLKNIGYSYFTPIDRLLNDADLNQIAMSTEGKVTLLKDGIELPSIITSEWMRQNRNHILEYQVYAPSSERHEAQLSVWVEAAVLAPMHLHMHEGSVAFFYAPVLPFVQRIGTSPGESIAIDDEMCIHWDDDLKSFKYVVVGDCTTMAGLSAPYEEEETTQVMKVECAAENISLLDFWFDHGNTDQFNNKSIEFNQFDDEQD